MRVSCVVCSGVVVKFGISEFYGNGEAKFIKDDIVAKTGEGEINGEVLESEKIAMEILDGIIDGVMADVGGRLHMSGSVTSVNSIEEVKSVSSSITR